MFMSADCLSGQKRERIIWELMKDNTTLTSLQLESVEKKKR